jgi:hypothetical protein
MCYLNTNNAFITRSSRFLRGVAKAFPYLNKEEDMTKAQDKNEKTIASLEDSIRTITEALRAANNEGKFRKKHSLIIEEMKYFIGNVNSRLIDKKKLGPLQW